MHWQTRNTLATIHARSQGATLTRNFIHFTRQQKVSPFDLTHCQWRKGIFKCQPVCTRHRACLSLTYPNKSGDAGALEQNVSRCVLEPRNFYEAHIQKLPSKCFWVLLFEYLSAYVITRFLSCLFATFANSSFKLTCQPLQRDPSWSYYYLTLNCGNTRSHYALAKVAKLLLSFPSRA